MPIVTPTFSFVPPPRPTFPTRVLLRLRSLKTAAKDELLAISLAHGVGKRYRGGSVSEYSYVVVANGDGRTCDATVFNMTSDAHDTVRALTDSWLSVHTLARSYLALLGKIEGKCETLHFEKFTVVIGTAPDMAKDTESVNDIQVLIHAEESLENMRQTVTELKAYFGFMRELNLLPEACQIEFSDPESLLNA
ncbi:hypothetical protein [Limimaricola sp. AA108-03]|uniref:hypothetical protein n=1 Tax=Limimaricola sp. AA108-03 TaxID=3425945 RepID=UPI003D76ED0D